MSRRWSARTAFATHASSTNMLWFRLNARVSTPSATTAKRAALASRRPTSWSLVMRPIPDSSWGVPPPAPAMDACGLGDLAFPELVLGRPVLHGAAGIGRGGNELQAVAVRRPRVGRVPRAVFQDRPPGLRVPL